MSAKAMTWSMAVLMGICYLDQYWASAPLDKIQCVDKTFASTKSCGTVAWERHGQTDLRPPSVLPSCFQRSYDLDHP